MCNLKHILRYEHEITISLQSGILTAGPQIILRAGHDFSNLTQILQINDKINFKGTMQINPFTNLPNEYLVINLQEISCLTCYGVKGELTTTKSINFSNSYIKYLIISARNILNFILNPIIVFQ